MSKSITEKELAETLREECDINRHNGWNHAARKIAEALGVTLTPEKPEPGTWHLTDNFTPGREFPAFVDAAGHLLVCDPSVPIVRWDRDEAWPALTPACMAPAKHGIGRVEVSADQVYGCIREVWDSDAAISPAVLTDEIMELLEGSK